MFIFPREWLSTRNEILSFFYIWEALFHTVEIKGIILIIFVIIIYIMKFYFLYYSG